MPTTTGGIANSGSGGWADQPMPRITPNRKLGARTKPKVNPSIQEPAPEPKKQTKQLIVGEKDPFMERLERYLAKNLGEMEDFQLFNTLAGGPPAPPGGTGIGPKAKEIQQRTGIDNSQRSEGDLSVSPNADVEEDGEED